MESGARASRRRGSPIDGSAKVAPDRLDLLHVEGVAPRRHLVLSVEHGGDEALAILRSQAAQVERRAAGGVPESLAVAGGAVIPVDRRSHLRGGRLGGRGSRRDEGGERDQHRGDDWRPPARARAAGRPIHRGPPQLPAGPEYSSNSLNVHTLPPAGTLARL